MTSVRSRKAPEPPKKEIPRAVSIIVPTYNEVDNVRPLCERIFVAMKEAEIETEVLIVDDESPGSAATVKIVNELIEEGKNVKIHCRAKEDGKGLSSAVLLGFQMAEHLIVMCMDADLQHEPESLPAIADPILKGEAEFVTGSRNCRGGGVGFKWSLFRRILSWGATLLAWPVAWSTDPMSGFFAVKKQAVMRAKRRINPIGFKIGLEIMARARCDPVKDVPITFRERAAGESKLSGKQSFLYLKQLAALYWDHYEVLLIFFFIVGIFLWLFIIQWTIYFLQEYVGIKILND
mmetsp:Transcript_47518/g.85783  ORF Transcript_47518/g.85783 Transcript_47518/m.85783 type:complete len:292 (-) Transcript_47518:121-996(-)